MTHDLKATLSLLDRLTKGPKPWLVTTTYKNGEIHTLRQALENSARNYAATASAKIGRNLINRDTGETVTIVSVKVTYSPETESTK